MGKGGPRRATPYSRWGGATSCKVRSLAALCWSSHEEIPHIQGKRNPSKMVGVQEGIRDQTHWNHNHRKLANLITRTTALPNSVKLSHAMRGPPKTNGSQRRDLTEWGSLEKGIANHFSIFALRTPWTVWKGKMIEYWKKNSPGQ